MAFLGTVGTGSGFYAQGYPLKAGHALLSCALMSREEPECCDEKFSARFL